MAQVVQIPVMDRGLPPVNLAKLLAHCMQAVAVHTLTPAQKVTEALAVEQMAVNLPWITLAVAAVVAAMAALVSL